MLGYFFKRLLWFIPTLFLVSVLIFTLSKINPVDSLLNELEQKEYSITEQHKALKALAKQRGLDLPWFYFSIYRASSTDTLEKIYPISYRKNLEALAYQNGSWKLVQDYHQSLIEAIPKAPEKLNKLSTVNDIEHLREIAESNRLKYEHPSLYNSIISLFNTNHQISNYQLNFSWHGSKNQYHHWLSNLLKGNWANSLISGRSETNTLKKALLWSAVLGFISLLAALLVAIPIGVYAAANPISKSAVFFNFTFNIGFVFPNFLLATLLLLLFASGLVLDWFPLYGVGDVAEDANFFDRVNTHAPYLVLPVFCYGFGLMAFTFRQVQTAVKRQIKQDYWLTSKSKGLSFNQSLWKHAFRNSLIPIITMIASSIPQIIGGSIVIETIFSIPGIGKLAVDAFLARDYPLILSITLLGSLATLISIFIADLAYQFADPRIKFNQTKA